MAWVIVTAIGIATTLLLWIYDKAFMPSRSTPEAQHTAGA
jgi:hypothetical protein